MSFLRTCKFHIWGGQRSTTIYQRVSDFQSNKARADGEHFVPFVFHKICCNLIFCCRSSIPYCRIILCVVQNVVRTSLLMHNAYGQYVNVGHICGFAVSVCLGLGHHFPATVRFFYFVLATLAPVRLLQATTEVQNGLWPRSLSTATTHLSVKRAMALLK